MAVIAKPAATTRKVAAPKVVAVKKILPNDGDKIKVTIVGYWDEREGTLTGENFDGCEGIYLDPDCKDITVEILEPGVSFEDGDVIEDADGDRYYRNNNNGWSAFGSSYSTGSPVRPFKKAEFK